jgi:hypothetical protein
MMLNHNADCPAALGPSCTYGRNAAHRFGAAFRNGSVGLHAYVGGQLTYHNVKCSTYRKAQRKLIQWLKGYNV